MKRSTARKFAVWFAVLTVIASFGAAGTRIDFVGGTTGATDNAVLRADGTGGLTAQSSSLVITDAGAGTLTSTTQIASINFVGTDRNGMLRNAGSGNGLAATGAFLEVWGSSSTSAGIIEGWNNNNTTRYYRINGTGVAFDQPKALTESSATAFVQVAVASGAHVGGRIHYTVVANDGTDYQTRTGLVNFSAVNKAGTETAGLGTVVNEAVAVSTGTLTVTIDTDTSPTNAVNFRANAVSSLTQTTLTIRYWVEIDGAAVTVTPQ